MSNEIYEMQKATVQQTCPSGHKGLCLVKNKETGKEMYSCDKCDAMYEPVEITDSLPPL